MALFRRKGQAPAPWDRTLHNPFVQDKDPTDGREGRLLVSVANWQRMCALCAVITILALVHAIRLGERIQPQTRTHIVEVSEPGQVRHVGMLAPETWARPADNTMIWLIKYWMFHVRTVGDSQVLLGQAWEDALAFTAPKMQPWLREQIAERYERFKQRETVQIKVTSVLPFSRQHQAYKVAWEETTISITGEAMRREWWEATLTVLVRPPQKGDDITNWRNMLGLLIDECHWVKLTEKRRTTS